MQVGLHHTSACGTMTLPFVAVHLGAGYHSESRVQLYERLCRECIGVVLENLNKNSLSQSLVAGISFLEASGIVNAGCGSNKARNGTISTDAAIMLSNPRSIGSVGCMIDEKNPISTAETIRNEAIASGLGCR